MEQRRVICVVMAVLVVSTATAAAGTRLGKSGRDKHLQVAAGGVVAEANDEMRGLLPKQRTAPSGPNGMQSPYVPRVPRSGQIQHLDPAEYDVPEPPPSPQRLD